MLEPVRLGSSSSLPPVNAVQDLRVQIQPRPAAAGNHFIFSGLESGICGGTQLTFICSCGGQPPDPLQTQVSPRGLRARTQDSA